MKTVQKTELSLLAKNWTLRSSGLAFKETNLNNKKTTTIGHFRVPFCLCVKASLCANPLIWKRVPPSFRLIFMQIRLTKTRKRHKVTFPFLVLGAGEGYSFGHSKQSLIFSRAYNSSEKSKIQSSGLQLPDRSGHYLASFIIVCILGQDMAAGMEWGVWLGVGLA